MFLALYQTPCKSKTKKQSKSYIPMLKLNCSVLNYYFSITVVYILQISVLWCVFMISGTTLNENTFEHHRKKINKYSILKHGLCRMHLIAMLIH